MIFESVVNLGLISLTLAFYAHDVLSNIESGEYPADYDPDTNEAERMSFDGIYDRRKKFDVETPMEFPTETKLEDEPIEEPKQVHSPADDYNTPTLYNNPSDHSSDENISNSPDDYPSESTETKSSLLTDGCLRCLCEASSNCDPQVRCHVEGPTNYNCGPFQINLNYWNDAGSPGVDQNDPLDFEECMNDIECSIDTVNSYMKRWTKDCDGDGRVSCDDYAKIHKAGAAQCNSTWVLGTPFWNKYKDCYFEYR